MRLPLHAAASAATARAAARRVPAATAACTAQPGSRSWRQSRNRHCGMRSRNSTNALLDCVRRAMRESEHLHAGRVDDPSGLRRAIGRARLTSSCGDRCAARRRSRRSARPRREASALISVDFPMPDWPMTTLCCPSSNGRNARDIARCGDLHDRRTRAPHRSAKREANSAASGRSDLFSDQHESAMLGLRGDDPAIQQMLVDGHVGRDHAEHLRDVGGDQLFPESVGAIEQAHARLDLHDHAAGGLARDANAVAACERHRTSLQHACDRAPCIELDDVMAPVRRNDHAGREIGAGGAARDAASAGAGVTRRTGDRSSPRR